MEHKILVYGTLRAYSDIPEATHSLKDYAMYDYGQFPYINPCAGSVVYGNILVVDDTELAKLDKYEGVEKGLYNRVQAVAYDHYLAVDVPCFVYVQNNLHPKLIESGDWHKR